MPGQPTEDPLGSALLGLPGVASVFLTADFVTVNKLPDATWDDIIEVAQRAIEAYFEL